MVFSRHKITRSSASGNHGPHRRQSYEFCIGHTLDYGRAKCEIWCCRGEDEELITVEPEDNSLSLVYRDKESLRSLNLSLHLFFNCCIREACPYQNG